MTPSPKKLRKMMTQNKPTLKSVTSIPVEKKVDKRFIDDEKAVAIDYVVSKGNLLKADAVGALLYTRKECRNLLVRIDEELRKGNITLTPELAKACKEIATMLTGMER